MKNREALFALINKLPVFDCSWSEELRSKWWQAFRLAFEQADKDPLYPQYECSVTHVYIGEKDETLAAGITVRWCHLFISENEVEDCLDVWSKDLAGTIAKRLNKEKPQ